MILAVDERNFKQKMDIFVSNISSVSGSKKALKIKDKNLVFLQKYETCDERDHGNHERCIFSCTKTR